MTHINIEPHQIRLEFPGWESLMTRRGTVTVPLSALRGVQVEPGWTSEVLGIRCGLVISGYRAVGTFRHPSGTRRLVSMTRGLPLLRLEVDRAATGFDEMLLSTRDGAAIADSLHAGARS
ncbi:hypothetical protein [Brachybacterium tyrofermentans]|uniref:DUF1905 domain-containing protein n=1 Tax=Brachybacterium tyrofermentans TaxID=47848 RepID=A0ABW0FFT6_9MICO